MAAVIPQKVHFEPGAEALRASKELSQGPSLAREILRCLWCKSAKLSHSQSFNACRSRWSFQVVLGDSMHCYTKGIQREM